MNLAARCLAAALLFAAPALAGGDAAKGAEVFQRCAMCHNADEGGGNGLGPNLFGVVGRKAASLPDFPYSPALKASRIVWTDDKLTAWVRGPSKLVPGTRMAFGGLTDPGQIDDLIAYLHSRK
jgi:cytochrome c